MKYIFSSVLRPSLQPYFKISGDCWLYWTRGTVVSILAYCSRGTDCYYNSHRYSMPVYAPAYITFLCNAISLFYNNITYIHTYICFHAQFQSFALSRQAQVLFFPEEYVMILSEWNASNDTPFVPFSGRYSGQCLKCLCLYLNQMMRFGRTDTYINRFHIWTAQ
jgi:hypothetical protein